MLNKPSQHTHSREPANDLWMHHQHAQKAGFVDPVELFLPDLKDFLLAGDPAHVRQRRIHIESEVYPVIQQPVKWDLDHSLATHAAHVRKFTTHETAVVGKAVLEKEVPASFGHVCRR